jgi:uncharacterized protein (TIGR02246 family)
MKYFFTLIFCFSPRDCRKRADQKPWGSCRKRSTEAWAKHDGQEWAKIMADDVDFLTVAATFLHGRADFEKFHTRLLDGRFQEASPAPLQTTARFLRPDMAVVHGSWKIEDDRNMDLTLRQGPRYAMITMVAEKREGTLAGRRWPEHERGVGHTARASGSSKRPS